MVCLPIPLTTTICCLRCEQLREHYELCGTVPTRQNSGRASCPARDTDNMEFVSNSSSLLRIVELVSIRHMSRTGQLQRTGA